MADPMQMYLYVHDAILREVADLENHAKDLNWDDPDQVEQAADRIDWFHTLVKKHEETEEKVLFPALNGRIRFVAETYEYDHDDFDAHVFGRIDEAVGGLRRAESSAERRELARLLYRQNVALHEHMRLHIAKENELLLPKLQAEFDVSEQVEMAGAMAGLVEPSLMGELVVFMYGGQSLTDRVGMVSFLRNVMPAEAFGALSGRLEEVNPSAWTDVAERLFAS